MKSDNSCDAAEFRELTVKQMIWFRLWCKTKVQYYVLPQHFVKWGWS